MNLYVLYWMISARRLTYNFGLERAVEWAQKLNKPLVILEALRCDYPWASDRIHHFVMDGMAFHNKKLKDWINYSYCSIFHFPSSEKAI